MRWIRCGDDHQLNGINRKQFADAAHDTGIRISGTRAIAAALYDRREMQAGYGADDRGMKYTPAESEADQSNLHGSHT